MKRVSKEIDDKAIKMIESGISITRTAKELGIDAQTLSKRLQIERGLIVLKDGKKQVNSSYFKEINTEDKAYWLGFLAADGSIGYENKDIELALKYEDKNHVEKFKSVIGSKHKIGKKQINLNGKLYYAARLTIRNQELHDDLCKYGVCARKSLITKFPFDLIPTEMYKHYLRGYFDGDGSIYSYNQANGKERYEIAISTGSEQMVNDLIRLVKDEIDIYLKFRESKTCYDLRLYDQNQIKVFLNYLYKDSSVSLDRKYELYTCAVLS